MILEKLTVKPLLIACGVLLLALSVVTMLYVGRGQTIDAQAATITQLQGQVTAANESVAAATRVNSGQTEKIRELVTRIRGLVGQNEELEEARRAALAERDRARLERDRRHREVQQLKEKIYANDQDCADWGARPVCAALTDQLRLEWGDAHRGADRDGAARGADPAADRAFAGAAGGAAAWPGADAGDQLVARLHDRLLLQPATRGDALPGAAMGQGLGGADLGNRYRGREGKSRQPPEALRSGTNHTSGWNQ